jgi:hypothetical protein
MGIRLVQTSFPQYVTFGEVDSLKGFAQRSFCAWIKPASLSPYQHILDINTATTFAGDPDIYFGGYILMISNGKIRFSAGWTASSYYDAAWDSISAVSAGGVVLFCVTYDGSSTANDPLMYMNHVQVGVTELKAPSGSLIDYATGHNPATKIGVFMSSDPTVPPYSNCTNFDGDIYKVLSYNRVLSPSEIVMMSKSRGLFYPRKGLIFNPNLRGAMGLQKFDMTVLSTSNLFRDPVSKKIGTPISSPVGLGESYLPFC